MNWIRYCSLELGKYENGAEVTVNERKEEEKGEKTKHAHEYPIQWPFIYRQTKANI